MIRLRQDIAVWLGLCAAFGMGCRSTVSYTNTDASASQQLLLSSSSDQVIRCFDFTPLAGQCCYLDTTGLAEEKDGYLRYRIREQLISQGVRLTEDRDAAEVQIEAGLHVYGTDSQRDEVGITDADSIPDIHLCVKGTQFGVVQLSMFAWEKESGAVIWNTPAMRADSYQVVRKIMGAGPYYSGSIEHSTHRLHLR